MSFDREADVKNGRVPRNSDVRYWPKQTCTCALRMSAFGRKRTTKAMPFNCLCREVAPASHATWLDQWSASPSRLLSPLQESHSRRQGVRPCLLEPFLPTQYLQIHRLELEIPELYRLAPAIRRAALHKHRFSRRAPSQSQQRYYRSALIQRASVSVSDAGRMHRHAGPQCEYLAGQGPQLLAFEEPAGTKYVKSLSIYGGEKSASAARAGSATKNATSHSLFLAPAIIAPGLGYSTGSSL